MEHDPLKQHLEENQNQIKRCEDHLSDLMERLRQSLVYSVDPAASRVLPSELLSFTVMTLEFLNALAEKAVREKKENPQAFERFANLVHSTPIWPGMLSPIKAIQERYQSIYKALELGKMFNLKNKKGFGLPKLWAFRLIAEIGAIDPLVSLLMKPSPSTPFDRNHTEVWKQLVGEKLDRSCGIKSIRVKAIQKHLENSSLNESQKAHFIVLNEKITSKGSEDEPPCILSEPGVEDYCWDKLKKVHQKPRSLYGVLRRKILDEVEGLLRKTSPS